MAVERMEAMQFADAIRSMLTLETSLVAQSINWLLVAQGFLFSAVAQLHHEHQFIIVFSLVGLLMPITFLHSFKTSEQAMAEILSRWNYFKSILTDEEIHYLPPVFAGGKKETRIIDRLLTPRNSLPCIFIVAWSLVLLITLFQ